MGFKRLKGNGLKKLLGIIKAKRRWAGKAFGTSLKLGTVWEKQHTKNDGSEDSVSGDTSRPSFLEIPLRILLLKLLLRILFLEMVLWMEKTVQG